jgi:tRNA pseudouridine13 synthase
MTKTMPLAAALSPPLLTSDLPGLGGRIKVFPEDFEVEEIPAYEPSGSGDFLYLWIEKRDMGAEYFVRQVAKRLDIPTGEVGTAGLKDRRAVTRQMVSVPGHLEERLKQIDGDGIRLLKVSRHGNKLRPGHLHGNRFRILVRDASPAAEEFLPPLLHRLRDHGLPNYYGPQRFGRDGETLHIGLALLRKEQPILAGGHKAQVRSPFLRKLALSAAQSGFFNHYLGRRLADGLGRTVLNGDVMAKVPFGGMFVAEDIETEQLRFDARETVTAGPIFGRKTFPAAHEAAQREEATLTAFGLTKESFGGFGKLAQGTRRHNLIYLADLASGQEPDGLRLDFTLPAGSYATVLLREIMKTEVADEDAVTT